MIVSVPAPVYTLSQLRLGAFSALEGCSVTASSAATGFPADNLIDGRPGTYWKAATPASQHTVDFTLAEAKWVDYAALYSSDLAALGGSVVFSYSHDGVTFTTLGTFTPRGTAPMYLTFPAVFAARYRMVVHSPMKTPAIGVVYMGQEFRPEHGVCTGFTPPTLGGQPIVLTNNSLAGSWLGRAYRSRVPYEGSLDLEYIDPERARVAYKPLLERMVQSPFFLKWHGSAFPYEIAYCWLDKADATMAYQKTNFMKTSIKFMGLVG
jgi:F5/8 type C domain